MNANNMKTALTIAGSDSCGGAGIQADIKTMTMNGVYAMSAITALTAQNTTGVRAISEVTPEFLGQQLDAVFEDIFPDAVKIGMVASSELIHAISEKLLFYKARLVDFVLRIAALEEEDLTIALEGKNVGTDSVKEPAVVADNHRTAGKCLQTFLQGSSL